MTNGYVLLVEDNADDELLTIRSLRKSGLANEIVVARDGAEALEAIFQRADTGAALPTMTLLDLKLPKVDGLEVLRRVRADPRTRTMPVIVLTTSREEEDVSASYQLGVNAYVRKPVAGGDFSDAVRTLGLFWLVVNEPPSPLRGQAVDDGHGKHPVGPEGEARPA